MENWTCLLSCSDGKEGRCSRGSGCAGLSCQNSWETIASKFSSLTTSDYPCLGDAVHDTIMAFKGMTSFSLPWARCTFPPPVQVNEFIKRVRALKIHLLVMGHLRKQLPSMFGRQKAQVCKDRYST